MRARMSLLIARLDFEHREIELRNKPQPMLEASPKGTVPVLILANGDVYDESLDIMEWALNQSDPNGWLKPDKDTQIGFIKTFEENFKPHLDRFKYANRFSHENDGQGVNSLKHRDLATAILLDHETRLKKNKCLFGPHPKLADIATFPFIRQFANADRPYFDGLDLPYVQKWLAQALESDVFRRCMVKVDLWQSN